MKRLNTWFASLRTKLGLRPNGELNGNRKSDEARLLDALAEYSRYDPCQTSQIDNRKTQSEGGPSVNELPTGPSGSASGQAVVGSYKPNSQPKPTKDRTEWRIMAFTFILALTAVITNFQTCSALRDSRSTFQESQRPYVNIGKKDGTIGYFIAHPGRDRIAVRLYFHNGGRMPAERFNVQLFAPEGPTTEQHMARFGDPSAPNLTQHLTYMAGLITIDGDTEIQQDIDDWIDQKSYDAVRMGEKPLSLTGFYEYCDQFGDYACRRFYGRYSTSPVEGFELVGAAPCTYQYPIVKPWVPHPQRYLNPCEQPDEREKTRKIEQQIMANKPTDVPAWTPSPFAAPTP